MPRLQRKALSTPDLVRTFPFGHVDVVNLDETYVARLTWEPGWRWSKDVKPVVQTASCQNRHVGYVISGYLHVVMDDGTELEIRAGRRLRDPAGHDAWVVGDEPWDTVEFASAAIYGAKPDENESVLATVLFTDIVDSTARLSQMGDVRWRGCCSSTTRRCARNSTDTADGRSARPATGSWPCSTARSVPSSAHDR